MSLAFCAILSGLWLGGFVEAKSGAIRIEQRLKAALAERAAFIERELKCLAENGYHEGRGESIGAQRAMMLITLARVRDADPQWQKTVCGAVGAARQFSWVLDHRLATVRTEKAAWEASQRLAREVYLASAVTLRLPRGWECVRYYKRTDDRGTSARGRAFFARLAPVATVGSHTFYRDPKRCVTRIATAP